MNLFYAPPGQVTGSRIELTGQEARHASRVMRLKAGDSIAVTDGRGTRYEGSVVRPGRDRLTVEWSGRSEIPFPDPACTLAMGVLRKRDRLEFAVEKATELGAAAFAFFRSRHTVKENVRLDRLEAAALSAMKQSLREWLPEIRLYDSLEELMEEHPEHRLVMAHSEGEREPEGLTIEKGERLLLLVGPEGGFSEEELETARSRGAELVSLGGYRLRAETAALSLLSRLPA